MRKYILLIVLIVTVAGLSGHDYIPGEPQTNPILLKGGDLNTVKNGLLKNTDLLFENGRITKIGKNLEVPSGAQVIDVTGRQVYPGLIAPLSSIGLIEIGSISATDDMAETGQIHPEVQAFIAYNPDSEIIPSVRVSGVTTALVVPRGGLLCGRSSLMNLDGWTYRDITEKFDVGLHVNWPRESISTGWWERRSPEEQRKAMAENRARLFKTFDDARAYYEAKMADPNIKIDSRWEAMLPIFSGEMPLFINANDYRQIEKAVDFAVENNFKMVLVGGTDAYLLTDLLKKYDIPVICNAVLSMPSRMDDEYDLPYKLPALLAQAGIKVCVSTGFGATGARNLPYETGVAVGFGMDKETALRSVTLTPAEIFGVDKDLGSLEVGKKATLVVSDGDIFDVLTSKVIFEFIEGKNVNLDDRHQEFYRKYQAKAAAYHQE